MVRILKDHRLTFLMCACFLCTGALLVAAVPKLELHVKINSQHTIVLDTAFKMLTLLGDGWSAAVMVVFLLLIRFRYAIMMATSSLASGFLAQFIKRILFPGMDRPAAFLDQMPDLETVSGVALHHHYSFPSGHAATAFTLLLLTGLIIRNRRVVFCLMLLACLAGFSRVYLSQHFLEDVLAGSFLGMFSALFFYWYFQGLKTPWLDRSILGIR